MFGQHTKKVLGFLAILIFLISLFTLLHFLSPQEIVEKIGVRNGYILAFLVSFFGGFSAGGSISFVSILITLVSGGLNPLYLGIIAGISLTIGDLIMFYAGSKGRELISGNLDNKIRKISDIFEKRNWLKNLTPFIAYIYIGLSPFPNDFMIIFLAAIKYPIKRMSVILILGDITFALIITLLAARGFLF